jgi:hypothetical protein
LGLRLARHASEFYGFSLLSPHRRVALIQTALERYGIEFVVDSSGVGTWLRKPSKSIIPAVNLNAENKPA